MAHPNFEIYQKFVIFIQEHSQPQRMAVNRRVFNVFFWCFILPVLIAGTILFMSRMGFFDTTASFYIDWIILLFPIIYTIYFLTSQVLADIPLAFKKGGVASALRRPLAEAEWRTKTVEELKKTIAATPVQWAWLASNFRMDLRSLQWRNRYLTLLAGAVFFLIMEGIDALDGKTALPIAWTPAAFVSLFEYVFDKIAVFVGLGFFLTVLYLSGSQVNQNFERFLNCVELIHLENSRRDSKEEP